MRSDKEIAQEALLRADNIRKQKIIRKHRIYGLCTVVACLVIILSLSFALPVVEGSKGTAGMYYATVFTGGTAGGYLLIGIIGFILGAVSVILNKKNKEG